jgi:hypothetical protein
MLLEVLDDIDVVTCSNYSHIWELDVTCTAIPLPVPQNSRLESGLGNFLEKVEQIRDEIPSKYPLANTQV